MRRGEDRVARSELRAHVRDCVEWRKSVHSRFEEATIDRKRMHTENSDAITKTQQKIDALEDTIRKDKAAVGKRENKFLRWVIVTMLGAMGVMAFWIMTHVKV